MRLDGVETEVKTNSLVKDQGMKYMVIESRILVG